jgi:transmembrane sensor
VEALHRARVDHPQIDRVLAWQRREVSLDNTPLAEAIAEMNRYSSRPLVFEGGSADAVFVTGLFRAGDSLNFARAVGVAYGFEVDEQPARIVLRK